MLAGQRAGYTDLDPQPGNPAGVAGGVDLSPSATVISWPPAVTREAASSTATIRLGARSATRPSSGGCWRSGRPCRASAPPSKPSCASPAWVGRKELATVVRLLETTLIRVGNDEYAKANRTFCLTTMRVGTSRPRARSCGFASAAIGQGARGDLRDRRLARLVRRMQELRGQELFQYLGEDGRPTPTDFGEVNDFLREIAGDDFTAKDFRTWSATVLAAWALNEFESFDSQAAAKRNLTQAIERVASRLGNTPAICRKSYVHPEILGAYLDGSLVRA